MIDHVTYHLSSAALGYPQLSEIMGLLGFEEVEPTDPFEHGYMVRWFRRIDPVGRKGFWELPLIHFVADGNSLDVSLGLGHFCVTGLGEEGYKRACASDYCARNSGSGRAWLEYDRLRVEVRP
jgi:hypothetical protein